LPAYALRICHFFAVAEALLHVKRATQRTSPTAKPARHCHCDCECQGASKKKQKKTRNKKTIQAKNNRPTLLFFIFFILGAPCVGCGPSVDIGRISSASPQLGAAKCGQEAGTAPGTGEVSTSPAPPPPGAQGAPGRG
jgi:hypothetical protein